MDKESGMKPNQEEVLRVAKESGFQVKTFSRFSEDPQILILTGSGDWDCFDVTDKLERFSAAMYEAGAAATNELLKGAEEDIQRKRDHLRFRREQLTAERAVSDKLLDRLKDAAESLRGYDCLSVAERCEHTIAEVEAMRKENKG